MGNAAYRFPEVISPFLREKLADTEKKFGKDSRHYTSIARKYLFHPAEVTHSESLARLRHYNADLCEDSSSQHLLGVERLYRRTILLELTTHCFSHCRWCLRSHYQRFTLLKDQVLSNIKLATSRDTRDQVREILITGGDPFIVPQILDFALTEIARQAENIDIIRIGTRIFSHNPQHLDNELIELLIKHRRNFRIELGTQVNSPDEFWPETVEAIQRVKDLGISIYAQNVLLKGVNDNLQTLVELYDLCRQHGIESHYLFHCVPMLGMEHHRTSVQRGLDLIHRLTAGGYISGRAKPAFTAMTDIGKITFYEGTILSRREESGELLLQSGYRLNERLNYNPGFQLPSSVAVDGDGNLRVWYPDGVDDNFWNDK